MKVLPVHPAPGDLESIQHYVYRLAALNGYPTAAWILSLVQQNAGQLPILTPPNEAMIKGLGMLSMQEESVVRNITVHRFARQLNLQGESDVQLSGRAAHRFLRYRWRKVAFCPRCLGERRPWSLLWSLKPVTACLDHETMLLDECPNCGARITLKALYAGTCKCGFELPDSKSVEVRAGSVGYQFQKVVQESLLSSGTVDGLPVNVWFATLDFLYSFLAQFPQGTLSMDGILNLPGSFKPRQEWMGIEHLLYGLASRTMAEGPSSAAQLCERWIDWDAPTGSGPRSLQSFTGTLGNMLHHYPTATVQYIRELLKPFLPVSWRTRPRVPDGWITVLDASRALKMSTKDVRALVNGGVLNGSVFPMGCSGHVHGQILRSSLIEFLNRQTKKPPDATPQPQAAVACVLGMPVHLAATALGLSVEALVALASAGFLQLSHGQIDGLDRFRANYLWDTEAAARMNVSMAVIHRLVKRGILFPVFQLGATRLFTLASIDAAATGRCGLQEAISIIGGSEDRLRALKSLAISGPAIDGARAYQFLRADVFRLLSSLEPRKPADGD